MTVRGAALDRVFGMSTETIDLTGATGVGLATIAADGTVLDTWFPRPALAVTKRWRT